MSEGAPAALMPEAEVRTLIGRIVRELAPNPGTAQGDDLTLVDDLEYTSLALLELAFTLEDEFELPPIDEETARSIVTIRDIEEHVLAGLRDDGRLAR